MKAETFIHYGSRFNAKRKVLRQKSLNQVVKAKENLISCLGVTTHYVSEIRIQSKNFKNNFKNINRF